MIDPGYTWLAKATIKAADKVADEYRGMGRNGARRAAYCEGIADFLRYLTDEHFGTTSEIDHILDRREL